MNRRIPIYALVVSLGLGVAAPAGSDRDPEPNFRQFARAYLARYFETHPVRATQLGVHDHDGRLPDLSQPAIRRRIRELDDSLERLTAIDRSALTGDDALDHRILDHAIRAELLELEEVRGWRHDPMLYNRLMADGTASLVDREFAPLDRRLTSLISRLEGYAALIRAARKNLRDVPVAWVELALRDARGHLHFLEHDVSAALREQGIAEIEPGTRARWALASQRATAELEQFVRWLERELAPRANGGFRMGRDLFERKLLYEEHVSVTVEQLLRMNERAIREYREWVVREAARIDPDQPVESVMRAITERHPAPDELIPFARQTVERAREFIEARGILTLPTDRLPIVRNTPAYARSAFASMSAPGPFETGVTEAYYNITNIDPSWSEEQQHQHLTYFNYPGLLGISLHEAMPGHFVQLLYQRALPSDVRKVFAAGTLVEGWAHYVEQMMIDEGFGDGDPSIRLGQLRRALQRHARWYAGIALHTTETTIDEATRRFGEIAYFAPFPARRETLRGTYNPTYLYYALGRMQILELREDYRAHVESRGEEFSLREFHDRFLKLGLPVSLAREVMLPPASAPGS